MNDKASFIYDDRQAIIQLDYSFMMYALNVLSGKWKLLILSILNFSTDGSLRYGDFKYILRNYIAPRVLIQQLRELEDDGLIYRVVYPTSPISVKYFITDLGKETLPIIDELYHFGAIYDKARKLYFEKENTSEGTNNE